MASAPVRPRATAPSARGLPLGIALAGASGADTWPRMLEAATRADALGLHSVWLPENHFAPGATPTPLLALAAFAAHTRRLRLATSSLLLPLHPPLRLAAEIAALDALSGGRVWLGLGRGFRAGVFQGFGVRARDKRDRFDAALDTMLDAWSRAAPARRPLQRPHPPLLVAAFGPKGLAQAARRGLPYLASPLETLDALEHNYALWRELRDRELPRASEPNANSAPNARAGASRAVESAAPNARMEDARAREQDAPSWSAGVGGAGEARAGENDARRARDATAHPPRAAMPRIAHADVAPRVPVMRNVFVAANEAEAARVRDALREESARMLRARTPNRVIARAAAGEVEERALIGVAAQVEDELARYRERLGLDLLVARVELPGAEAPARAAALERLAEICAS